jgi:DNA-binding MarR family transcriptional regulator
VSDEWYLDVSLPALLRGAWRTYGGAVRADMDEAGFDDVPRNGPYVMGAIARGGLPLSDIIAQLGLSKQAAGQLVDTLVLRGYLEREVDSADRRRFTVTLTSRGEVAAEVTRDAITALDERLGERVGADDIAVMRRTLAAILGLAHSEEEE